jgi:hypothetical protein
MDRSTLNDILVVGVILVALAFAIGFHLAGPGDSSKAIEVPPVSRAELELDRLRKEAEAELRQHQNQLQKLSLELQAQEASRKLEQQGASHLTGELRQQVREAQADLRSEVAARESLERLHQDALGQLKRLTRDHQDLEQRLNAEILQLRGMLSSGNPPPSSRVLAQTISYTMPSAMSSSAAKEARLQEWRRRFERGQVARDILNENLAKQRAEDLVWAADRLDVEGGTIDWPSLLLEPAFGPIRFQAEAGVRHRDLRQLSRAAADGIDVLEGQSRDHGLSMDRYLSAKRFLNALKNTSI